MTKKLPSLEEIEATNQSFQEMIDESRQRNNLQPTEYVLSRNDDLILTSKMLTEAAAAIELIAKLMRADAEALYEESANLNTKYHMRLSNYLRQANELAAIFRQRIAGPQNQNGDPPKPPEES
jgi:hypothetical protein